MQATQSSKDSQRRQSRRSPPPPSGGTAPRNDGESAGVELVLDSPDSFRRDHAVALRDLLRHFAAEYDLEEHLDRIGRPSAWMEGTAATCALCADPGPVLAAMLSTLDTALKSAETAEVLSNE